MSVFEDSTRNSALEHGQERPGEVRAEEALAEAAGRRDSG